MSRALLSQMSSQGGTLDLRDRGNPPPTNMTDYAKLVSASIGAMRSHMSGPGGKSHNRADLCLRRF